MDSIFFFKIKKIKNSSFIFEQYQKTEIFYSYFLVDNEYYLIIYSERLIEIDLLFQKIYILKQLNQRIRKIRSIRGFLNYALEIMDKAKYFQILNTNLSPFFWPQVRALLRQNQKNIILKNFLFGNSNYQISIQEELAKTKIEIAFLKQKISDIEEKIK